MSQYVSYPAYKDSGVEWLKQVPGHWQIKKLKYLASYIGSGKTPSGGAEVYLDAGVLFLRSQNIYEAGLQLVGAAFISDEIDQEMRGSRVKACDVLLNITGASIGRSCLVPEAFRRANVSQHVCIIRSDVSAISKWLSLCLPSKAVQAQINFSQNGAGREGLNFEQIGNFVVTLPPVEEINVLFKSLNFETARIDALIEKKARFIALLCEKRQALIIHAITRGLDSTVKVKDSGVEWLGEVPAHWDMTFVKRILVSIEQGWSPECESRPAEDQEWAVLKVGCVNGAIFRPTENKALPSIMTAKPQLGLRKGDVLVSRANTRELVGSCAVIPKDYPYLMLCDKLYRLRVSALVTSDFLAALIPVYGRRAVEVEATGASSSMVNIAQSVILNLQVALPPLDEQVQMMTAIKTGSDRLDSLIGRTERSITLLKERRVALITAAVTGKIDLREAV